jgi:hypothetical protein
MAERRTPYEIYWEILVYCKTPRTFTTIISRCDLNSKIGQEYLGSLIERGYIAIGRDGERHMSQQSELASTSPYSPGCIRGFWTKGRGSDYNFE